MLEIIHFLGDKLAELINISPPAARGLLKLAIKDEKGPFKPLKQTSLGDFRDVFEGSLKERLRKLEIPNHINIIENLLKILKENQSLVTMGV